MLIPMPNMMIFDDEEMVIVLPGEKEADSMVAIRNKEIVSAFEKYFNRLWERAVIIDSKNLEAFS